MRNVNWLLGTTTVLTVLLAAPRFSQAGEFCDNFDDGDFDGWVVDSPYQPGGPALEPEIVESPEGYALRGVSSDPAYLVHPYAIHCARGLTLEMRARSDGSRLAKVILLSGSDFYEGIDYGEFGIAVFQLCIDGQNEFHGEYPVDGGWHDFKWTRDVDGWWSLSIDGDVKLPNFVQNDVLTSFDRIGLELSGVPTEIEWVRVAVTECIPGDLNDDGCVDQADLGILLADWGCTGGDCAGDCDGDGDTDQSDLGILLAYWGEGCP